MSKYRGALPQLRGRLFLTDGGIETTLIFHDGLELPYFAAFALLLTPEGTDALRRYFRSYAALAAKHGTGLILESVTWRASADWGSKLRYTSVEFGREYAAVTGRLGWVNVLGGCCGTDDRHVDQIAWACAPLFAA